MVKGEGYYPDKLFTGDLSRTVPYRASSRVSGSDSHRYPFTEEISAMEQIAPTRFPYERPWIKQTEQGSLVRVNFLPQPVDPATLGEIERFRKIAPLEESDLALQRLLSYTPALTLDLHHRTLDLRDRFSPLLHIHHNPMEWYKIWPTSGAILEGSTNRKLLLPQLKRYLIAASKPAYRFAENQLTVETSFYAITGVVGLPRYAVTYTLALEPFREQIDGIFDGIRSEHEFRMPLQLPNQCFTVRIDANRKLNLYSDGNDDQGDEPVIVPVRGK